MGKTTMVGGAVASTLMAAMMAFALPATAQEALGTATSAGAVANGAKLHLQWELQRPVAGAQLPKGSSPARFTLTNRDTQALPAQGWSLYFNAIDRMPKGVQSNGLLLEQIAGGLFRLYPAPGFTGLAPGQAVAFDYQHSDSVYTSSKAPSGPYLVYDAAPDTGVALAYSVVPLAQPP
ncbi:carbohydate-binding domain-containing protein, partial [Massilia oculi]|uniref:carbohydate-binding domain-containing protein n=1 Tax=Massilia oculi TaxID=945844 RepID=UPI0028A90019